MDELYTIRRKQPDEKALSDVLYSGSAEDVLTTFVSALNNEGLDTECFYRIYKGKKLILKEGD